MADEEGSVEPQYTACVNGDDQYSIWRVDRDMPIGWTAIGDPGTEEECRQFLKETASGVRPQQFGDHQQF